MEDVALGNCDDGVFSREGGDDERELWGESGEAGENDHVVTRVLNSGVCSDAVAYHTTKIRLDCTMDSYANGRFG